jgi:hypothetical protein
MSGGSKRVSGFKLAKPKIYGCIASLHDAPASGLRQISLKDLRHLVIEAAPMMFRATPFDLLDFLNVG